MKIKHLRKFMKKVNEVFPLPADGCFKGDHRLELHKTLSKKPALILAIWAFNSEGEICLYYGNLSDESSSLRVSKKYLRKLKKKLGRFITQQEV